VQLNLEVALTTLRPQLEMQAFRELRLTQREQAALKVTQKTNSMVSVRERTIPTERPPLVGEVIANFCG
jgi:hypothetical protein